MSFIDRDFAWFLPLVLAFWWLTRGRYAAQIATMLCASLVFYGWRQPAVLGVIGAYCLVDWSIGIWLDRTRQRRAVLVLGLAFNLSVLCFWKYTPLVLTSLAAWLHRPELAAGVAQPGAWSVPMGISFYSFTGIAYMVDVYRRVGPAEQSLWRYSLFTSFFPHLVAGPILRAREFLSHLGPDELPQRPKMPMEALGLIARGFFKKLVLADSLALAIDPFFAEVAHPATAGIWALPYLYLYAWQIYFDFSGYTDIARGLGLAFGFRWPENFRAPYLARSIQDFWRRWHMTLSRFLRDYLYIPLGGNRGGAVWSAFTVMMTMTLGGFWHGASWSFLTWGAVHGIFLLMHRGWRHFASLRVMRFLQRVPQPIREFSGVVITFNAVSLAWAFFRLTNFGESWACLRKVVSFDPAKALVGGAGDASLWLLLIAYAIGSLGFAALRRGKSLPDFFAGLRGRPFLHGLIGGGAVGLLVVSLLLARTGEKAPFIYFQF